MKELKKNSTEAKDMDFNYYGWQNVPNNCLRVMIKYPYVYDLVKFDILKFEFHLEEKEKKYREDRYMGCLSGMVGELVRIG